MILKGRVLSLEAKALVDFLGTKLPGDLVRYDEIATAVGFDPTDPEGRNALHSARRKLLAEQQRAFKTMRCIGLLCLDDAGKVSLASHKLRHVRSAARRSRKVAQAVVDFSSLSPVDKARQQAVVAVTAAVEAIAGHHVVKKIEAKAAPQAIDMRAMLKGFVSA